MSLSIPSCVLHLNVIFRKLLLSRGWRRAGSRHWLTGHGSARLWTAWKHRWVVFHFTRSPLSSSSVPYSSSPGCTPSQRWDCTFSLGRRIIDQCLWASPHFMGGGGPRGEDRGFVQILPALRNNSSANIAGAVLWWIMPKTSMCQIDSLFDLCGFRDLTFTFPSWATLYYANFF